jgi:DNA mismatch repair protein MutS2
VRDGLAARRRDLVKAAAEQRAAARPVAAADIEAIDAERAAVDAEALRVQDALPSPASPPAGEAPRGAGDGGPLDDAAVVPGAAVWLTTLQKGARIQEVRGDRVALLVGDVSVTARRRELRRLSGVLPAEGSKAPKQKTIRVVSEVPRAPELDLDDVRTPPPRTDAITADLRGQRREDVQPVVEPLLDRAFREQNEAIWVIHGHGTGAMRDEVREFLARSPYVLGWRPGRRNEGGDGVTIAFLHRV